MKKTILLLALLLPFSASNAHAQNPGFGETVEVNIVNVEVVVTDKDGKPVAGLTQDDFQIFENGKPQEITNYAEYRLGGGSREPDATAAAQPRGTKREEAVVTTRPPEKRYLIFFIDTLVLDEKESRDLFFDGLRNFIDRSMRVGDEAGLLVWRGHLQTRVPLTGDRTQLFAEIAKLEKESVSGFPPEDVENTELEMRAKMYSSDEPDAAANMESDARAATQRAYERMQSKTASINAVLSSLAGLEGRKILVMATHRFSMNPGLDFGIESQEYDGRPMIDSVVRNANASRVAIYGMNPEGMAKDVGVRADRDTRGGAMRPYLLNQNEVEALSRAAEGTGGSAVSGAKLAADELAAISSGLDQYYSIAYHASPSKGTTRKIDVRVKKPGLRVMARTTVVEKNDDELMKDRVIAGLLYRAPHSDLYIRAFPGESRKKSGGKVSLKVDVKIPISELTLVPYGQKQQGKFRVFAAAAKGAQISPVVEREQFFEIPVNDLPRAMKSSFTYNLDLLVNEGSDRLSIIVMDDISKQAGYTQVSLGPASTGERATGNGKK